MKPKRILGIAMMVIFLFPCFATAGRWKNESGKGAHGNYDTYHGDRDDRRDDDDRGQERYHDRRNDRHHESGRLDRDHDRYREYRDYDTYRGYRVRPHDRGRHYGHYKHERKQYEYQGHWRSWDDWDRYARKHPRIYEHGHYYRENAHLMFRFCDPGGDGCYFFSIGK